MGGAFVSRESVRVKADDESGEWIDVKPKLSVGDREKILNRSYQGMGKKQTVTIGTAVYTSHADPDTVANQYLVSTDTEENAAAALVDCINASGTATNYGSLTVANPDVVATQNGAVVILTAKVPGTASNGILLSTDETNGTAAATTLGGCAGTDGSGSLSAWAAAALHMDAKARVHTLLRELV